MRRRAPVVLLAIAIVGCQPSPPRSAQPEAGDADLFATQVQPILVRHCAFLGCHGREGTPLTFYAVDYLRLRDPEGVIDFSRPALDETALAPAELLHNQRTLAARAGAADPGGERLLSRLVAPAVGGIPHGGVVVFASDREPDFVTLRQYLGTIHAQ